MGAPSTIASLTSIFKCAFGLFMPFLWFLTATAASVFLEAPYCAK